MTLANEYCDKCGKLHSIAYCPNEKSKLTDSTIDKALLVTPTTFADVYKKLNDVFNSNSMEKLKKHYFSRVETLNYNYHNL